MSSKFVLLTLISFLIITALISQTMSSQFLVNVKCVISQSGTVNYPTVSVDRTLAETVHNLNTGLNYTTIQEAIDANRTLDGHTILVDAGTYYENIVVNKSIKLVGENAITTVLDGESESLLILGVVASDATVRNFTVKNTRADQPAYGISIKDSQNVSLVDVTVEEGYTGLVLDNSSLCEVVNSVFKNSYAYGVDLRDNSVNNTVVGNWIVANPTGIAIMDMTCENNRFHHNNFVNNTNQIDVTYAGSNIWDDRNEGNYWSNYNGIDLDSDGIGDTYIPWEAVDNYPLMGTFSDFNATSEYHIQTVCNSTISDFNYNGSTISFNVSGANGTAGFCRICIPKALMNETYWVFVNGTEILPAPLPLPCSNGTHNYLYFNYTHSIQEVVIVPEFPSIIILPLFMIATLLAVIVYKRKHQTRNKMREV